MASSWPERPPCKYGSKCYRTSEEHRWEFSHPQDHLPEKSTEMNGTECPGQTRRDGAGQERSRSNHCFEQAPAGQTVGGAFAKLNVNAAEIFTEDATRQHVSSSTTAVKAAGSGSDESRSSPASQSAPSRRPELEFPFASGTRAESEEILLMLVGLPGSGKSTFCEKLVLAASQPWVRVCQDVLKSRKACLKHAKRALEGHISVLLDRCNFDVEQRSSFVTLAATAGVKAHALVLDLPQSLCVERASKRIGHEGKVEGDGAGRIVGFVSRGRKYPSLAEGFYRITICRTDTDVERALQDYRGLEQSRPLGPGVFGDVGRAKARNSETGLSQARATFVGEVAKNQMGSKDKNLGHGGGKALQRDSTEESSEPERDGSTNAVDRAGDVEQLDKRQIEGDGRATILAFPSISTADFQFDLEKASSVLVESVSDFLLAPQNLGLRLMLVDLTNSAMLSRVRTKVSEFGLDSQRFFTHVGDITKLRSSGGPDCSVIANAANWRLKAGGGGVNAAIYSAAGADLEKATKAVAQTIHPGESIVVGLPGSSPLHQREGVTHVIHVLGPNMNPQRPNCLSGDYDAGCRILRSAYTSLFENFSSLGHQSNAGPALEADAQLGVKIQSSRETSSSTDVTDKADPPRKNAFAVLMQASRRSLDSKNSSSKPSKIRVTEELAARASLAKDTRGFFDQHVVPSTEVRNSETENVAAPNSYLTESGLDVTPNAGNASTMASGKKISLEGDRRAMTSEEDTLELGRVETSGPPQHTPQERVSQIQKNWPHFTLALFDTAMHPERHADVVLQTTDDAVVIHDAYPKAKQHILVLARKVGLDGIDDIRYDDVPILKRMHALGEEWAASLIKSDPSLIFRLGYHSVPSMRQLHLHVISQDFESVRLKNKKHWNSFTSSFFLDSVDVILRVEKVGRVHVPVNAAESMLDTELRCHRCKSAHPNLPRLKQHIARCLLPFPKNVQLITSGGSSVQ